ncbi:MAG: FAD-binding protein, partial [Clostridia bacterium]|nr:FAD-binding protein [Clostridia bacterium]
MPLNSGKYDVLIVGSGLAGLYAALNLDSDLDVLLISKAELKLSNSTLAQGGVAAVLDTENDDYDLHFKDTMIAGRQVNNEHTVKILVENGPDDVRNIINMGVDFDRNDDGSLRMTLEGGHSRNRIVHHKDSTGDEITTVLIERVKSLPNVEIRENILCSDILHAPDGFFANLLVDGEYQTVSASFVILATGGIGRVYKYTTNSKIATGDGIRFAYELGAKIKDLDYIQFHPTAFAAEGRERFLISEAVRGEGAYLL